MCFGCCVDNSLVSKYYEYLLSKTILWLVCFSFYKYFTRLRREKESNVFLCNIRVYYVELFCSFKYQVFTCGCFRYFSCQPTILRILVEFAYKVSTSLGILKTKLFQFTPPYFNIKDCPFKISIATDDAWSLCKLITLIEKQRNPATEGNIISEYICKSSFKIVKGLGTMVFF